jgi:hemerythrin-like domain-containing protein
VLLAEHKLIERMVSVLTSHLRLLSQGKIDVEFLNLAVDFFRVYADKCHHGKEERFLFPVLQSKDLPEDEAEELRLLKRDHSYARELVEELINRIQSYLIKGTTTLEHIGETVRKLAEFYISHMDRESALVGVLMRRVGTVEQIDLLREFWEYDRNLVHDRYNAIVEQEEARAPSM